MLLQLGNKIVKSFNLRGGSGQSYFTKGVQGILRMAKRAG